MAIKNPLTRLKYDPTLESLARREFLTKTAIPELGIVGVINSLKELIRYVQGLPVYRPKMRQAMEDDLNFLYRWSSSYFQSKRRQTISRARDIKLSKRTIQKRAARTRNKKLRNKKIINIDIPKDTNRGDWCGRG